MKSKYGLFCWGFGKIKKLYEILYLCFLILMPLKADLVGIHKWMIIARFWEFVPHYNKGKLDNNKVDWTQILHIILG